MFEKNKSDRLSLLHFNEKTLSKSKTEGRDEDRRVSQIYEKNIVTQGMFELDVLSARKVQNINMNLNKIVENCTPLMNTLSFSTQKRSSRHQSMFLNKNPALSNLGSQNIKTEQTPIDTPVNPKDGTQPSFNFMTPDDLQPGSITGPLPTPVGESCDDLSKIFNSCFLAGVDNQDILDCYENSAFVMNE